MTTSRFSATYVSALAGALLVGAMLAGPIAASPLAAVVPIGVVALGALFIASSSRPLAVAALGFGMLAAVRIEPAPVDVVFACVMVVTFMSGSVRPQVPASIQITLVLLAAITIGSSINAIDTFRAASYASVTMYLLLLTVWLSWFFTDRWATVLSMRVYIGVAAASSLAVLAALYIGFPGSDILVYDGARGQGLFKDPNVYAAFLVPPAALLLEEIGRPAHLVHRRILSVPLFVLIAAGVAVGFSRAAWLNLAIAAGTVVLVSAFRRGGLKIVARVVAVLILAVIAGIGLVIATGSLEFLRERSRLESYDQDRFGAQSTALERMGEHILGHGPGQVEGTLDISTHSLFARAAFEQGLIGLVLISGLVVLTLACAIVLTRKTAEFNGVGTAALLGSWLGLMASSVFVDTIHWRHFYVVAALIWSGYMTQTRARPTPSSRNAPEWPTNVP